MIYEQYRAKIKKRAKIWATIKRFRVLILTVLISVTATVTGLLVARGTVYDTTDMPALITYGEGFTYKAKGFMSKVSYEYSPVGLDEWTTEIPNVPGAYRVRAVTKATFGGKRYGKAQQFTLQPKTVTLSVAQSELVYGNAPTLTGDLIPGDRAVCSQYAYTGIGTDTVTVQAQPQSVRIYAQDGRDVTACYTVRTTEQNVTITARPITVRIADATHVYDGTEFSAEEYTLSDGSLAFSDELSALFTARVTDYTAQPVNNTATFSVSNADGVNVTGYYDITVLSGTLTVEKRALFIQTQNRSQVYNGNPLSAASSEFTADGLVDGQTIAVKEDGANSIIKTGSVQNAFTPVITDGEGKDTTDNYTVSFPEDSFLTVTPRKLTVTSEDGEKVYDGTPLSVTQYEQVGLVGGDELSVKFTGERTVVGATDNLFTVNKIESSLGDVTSCYEIVEKYGTLTVTPRKIRVATSTLEKVYDGKPLQEEGRNGDFSSIVLLPNEEEGYYGLVAGHKLLASATRASITDVQWIDGANGKEVGSVTNTVEFFVNDAKINENYDIVYVSYGTLKITPRPITVKSPDDYTVYNGTPFTCKEENVLSGDSPFGYADDQEGVASNWASLTEANADFGEIKQGLENNRFDLRIKIKGTEETYTTDNYAITYRYGSLTVQRRLITLTAKSDKIPYNGKEQTIEKNTVEEVRDLLSGHQVYGVTTFGASGTNAGEYPHAFDPTQTNVCIKDGDNEVTQNYQISFEGGKLTITPRAVYIVTNDVRWLYDGLEHYDGDGIEYTHNGVVYKNDGEVSFKTGVFDGVTYTTLGEEHRLEEYRRSSMIDVLWDNAKVTSTVNERYFNVVSADGETDTNYVIRYEYGTMIIDPRPITVKSENAHKVYDGTALVKPVWSVSENSGYGLVVGQEGVVDGATWTGQTDANADFGIIKDNLENNQFVLHVRKTGGEYTTANYDITYEYGSLTVQKRPIFVTTRDCTWVYDGTPHSDGDGKNYSGIYTNDELTYNNITYYPLVDGHSLFIVNVTFVRFWEDTKDGGKDNVLTFMVDNEEINKNYTITIEYGKLTIEKRPIYIQGTHSIEWIYDGKTHYDGDAQSLPYGNDDLWKGGNEEYTILALNDTLEIATPENERCWVTYVWDSGIKNVLTFTVKDGQGDYTGDNYADNYDIRQPDPYTYGTLTILPRPIYVTETHALSWVYDGEAHYDDGTESTRVYGEGDLLVDGENYYTLIKGDRLVIATPTEERTHVTYVWDSGAQNILEFTVSNDLHQGDNYADNYDIRQPETYGALTILPRPILIQTHGLSWVYNGEAHCDKTEYSNDDVIDGTLVKQDSISLLTEEEDRVHVKNVADSGAENTLAFTVIAGEYQGDEEYARNYEILYLYGKLEIRPRPIRIDVESEEVAYDAKEHALSAFVCEEGSRTTNSGLLVDIGHTLSIDFKKNKEIGVYEGSDLIDELRITDEHGERVDENYAPEIKGRLTIVACTLKIGLKELWKSYDGKPLAYTADSWWIQEGNLPEGWTIRFDIEGVSLTEVGELSEDVLKSKLFITDENGALMYGDGNETIVGVSFNNRLLRIASRKITLKAKTIAKVFDNTPLTGGNTADIIFGSLVSGHRIELKTKGSQLYPGECINTIVENSVKIYDAHGVDVTGNYAIALQTGLLTVVEDD